MSKSNAMIFIVTWLIYVAIVTCMCKLKNKLVAAQIHFLVCFLTRLDVYLFINSLSLPFLSTVYFVLETLLEWRYFDANFTHLLAGSRWCFGCATLAELKAQISGSSHMFHAGRASFSLASTTLENVHT